MNFTYEHRTTDLLGLDSPLILDSGATLRGFRIAYETYGQLNADRSNAILICHALTGDQYVASSNPITGRPAWWDRVVGPGRPIDTEHYYVICSNILGGCMGSEGPVAVNEATGRSWGIDFPLVTIGDMVSAQGRLLDFIGVEELYAVVGGSMGGMQALEWLRRFPERTRSVVALATSYRQHVQNVSFHIAGRQAIMNDPGWSSGAYTENGTFPEKGLAIARMIAHVTYLSAESLNDKFGRRLQEKSFRTYDFGINFQIESYLRHQGKAFTERFDPNSYLYITQAVDFFDQSEGYAGDLEESYQAALDKKPAVCLISFSSDWMYPPAESRYIETALRAVGVHVEGYQLEAEGGHDAFLLENPEMEGLIRAFLSKVRYRSV
jgi:homoserine O-acetyltransferase/O-succinyltransferase